jgi:zinc D-Ala-D-Ala dipeptidase
MRDFLIVSAATIVLAMSTTTRAAEPRVPAGFVELRQVDATIQQDMRYAGSNNFTGRPLPGYEKAQCILKRAAAEALARVQRELAAKHRSLKVFDCYRPVGAVKAMVDWAHDGKSAGASKRFFPRNEKSALFSLGYIATRSAHSRGIAVDLNFVDLAQAGAKPGTVPTVPCTAPYSERGPADGVDMGTGFDCFDTRSHTASPDITADQRRRRLLLVNAMRKHGFVNYAREWWHFSYRGATTGH